MEDSVSGSHSGRRSQEDSRMIAFDPFGPSGRVPATTWDITPARRDAVSK
jgi:hypothetical protein